MKNTMKKLLCMALAIMLLVSVVPVGAMAEEDAAGYTLWVRVDFMCGGDTVKTWRYSPAEYGAPDWSVDGAAAWAVNEAGLGGLYSATGVVNTKLDGYYAEVHVKPISTEPPATEPPATEAPSQAKYVNVTFQDRKGNDLGTWSYSDEIGEPNWNTAGAAAWAMNSAVAAGNLSRAYDNAEVLSSSNNGYTAVIKVWDNERTVNVTFQTPDGNVTWSYYPSTYATADNDGSPNWSAEAPKWAMNEAVKKQVLSKNYDNATLISVSSDGYAATIKLSDNASATDPTTPPATGKITVTIKIGTTVKVDAQDYFAAYATVNELIKHWNPNWEDDYDFVSYKVGNNAPAYRLGAIINAGQSVTINLSKSVKDPLHDKLSSLKPVILHVYLNNNFNAEHAHYTITSIAEDGTLDLNKDVKEFLLKYYTAQNSNGIGYDGMYVADGYFGVKYLADQKYVVLGNDADASGNTTLDYMRSEGYVHLNVMLTNAKAKSSSTADSSNPKTGDTIFVPVMVMGVTGTVLAAAYVFGKKRIAR